jgi:glycosyltransferase involved in cell wall biosynthesis
VSLNHRGPDDQGMWHDATAGTVLAHRRLSILELSPAGHQPMLAACGRWVLVFNAEIYKHLSLRRDIELTCGRRVWRGHSDTETLLACFVALGCRDVVNDGVSGFLYRPRDACGLADKMVRMIAMPQGKREAMDLVGRGKVERKFDEKLVIDKYMQAIEAVLGRKNLAEFPNSLK